MAGRIAVGLAAIALAGCGVWRPTRVPMRTISLPAACDTKPSTLLVFLQGSYSMPEDYISHGFVDGVRREHIAADISLVDAHLGYYNERSILDRLREDVLVPARSAGYRDVWLVGISIGAYGAMLSSATTASTSASTSTSASMPTSMPATVTAPTTPASSRAAAITGTIAIAPYLGSRGLSESIVEAGGLASWHAPAVLSATESDQSIWRWLQRAALERPEPRLYLGYGRDDRFATSDRVLAAALPAGHVFTAPGGHDWPAWEDVWRQMLPTLPLPRDASCKVAITRQSR